jgi:hypothetical protein
MFKKDYKQQQQQKIMCTYLDWTRLTCCIVDLVRKEIMLTSSEACRTCTMFCRGTSRTNVRSCCTAGSGVVTARRCSHVHPLISNHVALQCSLSALPLSQLSKHCKEHRAFFWSNRHGLHDTQAILKSIAVLWKPCPPEISCVRG